MGVMILAGCESDQSVVRRIQARDQQRLAQDTEQDHLGEAFRLVRKMVGLNADEARRQVAFQLNQWSGDQPTTEFDGDSLDLEPIAKELAIANIDASTIVSRTARETYGGQDIEHLRDAVVIRSLSDWITEPDRDLEDPVLKPWFDSDAIDDDEVKRKLRSATVVFDWVRRNIAWEPTNIPSPVQPPAMPPGIDFLGSGYRQSMFQTLFRGRGDWIGQAHVMIDLCRQMDVPAAILAIPESEWEEPENDLQRAMLSPVVDGLRPWCVGIVLGPDVYLFDLNLGTHVPGPDQNGIATLAQARRDASVLRRMNVPGFFDYPVDKDAVQSVTALLPVAPEDMAPRMRRLERSLTGDLRANLFVDVPTLRERVDDAAGVSAVRLWSLPLAAESYAAAMERASDRDVRIAQLHRTSWLMLEADFPSARQLAMGRWMQLTGQFDDVEQDNVQGARTLYLKQRSPEFEIADLRTDPDLQQQYGIRRELGTADDAYDQQIQIVQQLMRAGKRTATYWLSLVQYDDQLFANAKNWLADRVMDDDQRFIWEPAARYNLARTHEQLGEYDQAIEIYKTRGLPREHGHRIRARLLARLAGEGSEDSETTSKSAESVTANG